MSSIGRWNGIFCFVPLLLIAVSRFDVLVDFGQILAKIVMSLTYLLILSTIASIIDRTLAPRRLAEP